MRALTLLCCLLPLPALAETLSQEIGRSGLTATAARLETLASPGDVDRFALGGVRFLAAVEAALQKHWAAGWTDPTGMLPFLRLPVPENPDPVPADPALITTLFRDMGLAMETARAPLADIPDSSGFGLDISFGDLWFDVNANATRDQGEDMMPLLGPALLGWRWSERDPAAPAPVVRFDVADAVWLSAYTHLLGGFSDLVQAYDPTAALTQTLTAKAAMAALGPAFSEYESYGLGTAADVIATLDAALSQQPDATRTRSAQQHFLAMITDNRRFWALVETETDNAQEWLPNDRQTSALGLVLPPGTGTRWLAVLTDVEGLLQGTRLVPYWRVGDGAGVNVARMFTDPQPIDIIGWIQGRSAVPYLQTGTLVTAASWMAFEDMMLGEAMLMSIFLN
jgi:hypothetical protein